MPHSKTAALAALLVAVLISLPLASCAPPRARPAGAAYDDATISTRVKTALLNDPDVAALKIDVRTSQGVVTLTGTARSSAEEQKAIEVARRVQGVKDVRSELKVGG